MQSCLTWIIGSKTEYTLRTSCGVPNSLFAARASDMGASGAPVSAPLTLSAGCSGRSTNPTGSADGGSRLCPLLRQQVQGSAAVQQGAHDLARSEPRED